MRLFPCKCAPQHYMKIHRKAWMKALFPSRGLYECKSCGKTLLIQAPRELRRLP